MVRIRQFTFSDLEYADKLRTTRRENLLKRLDAGLPWSELVGAIEPYYPVAKASGGRPAMGIEKMLRMYVVQNVLGLSDEQAEDALYDSLSVREFVGVSGEKVPDATTLTRFRQMLEQHDLGKEAFLKLITQHLNAAGMSLNTGTVVDATLIAAPSSTKNKDKQRDSEMHSSKKGNQWYFGLKAHIGVDAEIGLTHSVEVTAGNVSDVEVTTQLLHGEETEVFADAGYVGIEKREEVQQLEQAPTWHVATRYGKRKALVGEHGELIRAIERKKAGIRAKVEHPFHVIKNIFKYRKVRYRGLKKNGHQITVLLSLANVLLAGRKWRGDGIAVS